MDIFQNKLSQERANYCFDERENLGLGRAASKRILLDVVGSEFAEYGVDGKIIDWLLETYAEEYMPPAPRKE